MRCCKGVNNSGHNSDNMGIFNLQTLNKLGVKRILSTRTYWSIRKMIKKTKLRATYVRKQFNFDTFSDEECRLFFRFSRKEIFCLLRNLAILKINRLENRTKFSGVEGICILLRRLSYPNKLSDLVSMFNRDEGSISRIFNYMLKWMYTRHAYRLHSLEQNYLTRQEFINLAENSSERGCPYPNIIGFIDGTCRSICRPKYNQQQMYSGYKKRHVAKYQSVVLTNGLIGRLDGPFIGRRHDAAIVHLSGILEEMKTVLTNNDGTYWAVYGDAGYSNQKYIKVGFKDFASLNRKQKDFNRLMSSLRVGVEYGFGKIIQQFAYLDYRKTQKQYLSHLKEMFYVAAFLTNCQACIRGRNQVSDIFGSYVPTLEEYLS